MLCVRPAAYRLVLTGRDRPEQKNASPFRKGLEKSQRIWYATHSLSRHSNNTAAPHAAARASATGAFDVMETANVDAIVLRLEDLTPVRCPELYEPGELVYVVEAGEVWIAHLEEAAALPRGPSDYRH